MNKRAVILLVEDNSMDVELTLKAFQKARIENSIQVARNGKEALDYVFSEGKYTDREKFPIPDLILLDLKLPGIDGHEVLRRVKNTEVYKRLPVVILTSSKDEGDRILGYDYGVNSYLTKPVSFEDFLEVVRQVGDYWLSLNVGPPEP